MKKTKFEHAEPILCVRDMSESVKYYCDVLGFTNAPWGGEEFETGASSNKQIRTHGKKLSQLPRLCFTDFTLAVDSIGYPAPGPENRQQVRLPKTSRFQQSFERLVWRQPWDLAM
jgi:hypothetical protein